MALINATFGIFALAACLAGPALAQSTEDQGAALGEIKSINAAEIKAGQLAEVKSSSKDVKDYGKRLVADHKRLNIAVEKYSKENGVTVPTAVVKEITDLEAASGDDFDKKFLDQMVKDHEEAITKIKGLRDQAVDTKYKTFLTSVISSLEKHHAAAEKLEKKRSS